MNQRDDSRDQELNNLRLALATFALQLDAFEMRTRGGLARTGIETGIATPRARRLQASEGENGWSSIKSPGSKSGT
jgi:hypothetical protein